MAASMAPEAPNGWPYKALVPLMGIRDACSPKIRLIAWVSVLSLSGVELPCALI